MPNRPAMVTSQKALSLIKAFESLHDGDLSQVGLQPKQDPIGIWTVGYGRALRHPVTGRFLKGTADKALAYSMYPQLSEMQASEMLMADLKGTYEESVRKMIGDTKLTDDQFGALVSFAYNCGTHYGPVGARKPFAIWQHVRMNLNKADMQKYWETSVIKAGGKILKGLVRRRKAEALLFTQGILKLD